MRECTLDCEPLRRLYRQHCADQVLCSVRDVLPLIIWILHSSGEDEVKEILQVRRPDGRFRKQQRVVILTANAGTSSNTGGSKPASAQASKEAVKVWTPGESEKLATE